MLIKHMLMLISTFQKLANYLLLNNFQIQKLFYKPCHLNLLLPKKYYQLMWLNFIVQASKDWLMTVIQGKTQWDPYFEKQIQISKWDSNFKILFPLWKQPGIVHKTTFYLYFRPKLSFVHSFENWPKQTA